MSINMATQSQFNEPPLFLATVKGINLYRHRDQFKMRRSDQGPPWNSVGVFALSPIHLIV